MTDPSRIAQITAGVTALAAGANPLQGICYRCSPPKHSRSSDFFSGAGSKYASGRYHLKGLFTIVYTSFQADWAMDEYCATARNAGISVAHLLPITIAAAEFDFSRILDLTDIAVLNHLSTTRDELVHNDWQRSASETVSQLIGRLASDNGFEAVVAPSMHGRKNLNLLRDNFLPTSKFQIINSADLPSNP